MTMIPPKIIAYLSPFCFWTRGVVKVLEKYGLDFEYRNVASNPDDFEEMAQKSGQYSSPCVEINGHMLADVGGDEVEDWMRQHGLLETPAEA